MQNTFYTAVLYLAIALPAMAQYESAYMVLWVTSESELTVTGRTNLNTFQCNYLDDLTDTLWIAIERSSDVYHLQNTTVSLQVDAFDCGGKLINKDFRKLLRSDKYLDINVHFQSFHAAPDDSVNRLGSLMTRFELAGGADTHSIDILKRSEAMQSANYYGFAELDITNFGLEPPTRLLGMVKVDKMIRVQFDLNVIVVKPFRAINDG